MHSSKTFAVTPGSITTITLSDRRGEMLGIRT